MRVLMAATLMGALASMSVATSFAGATISTTSVATRYEVIDLGIIQRLAADIVPGLSHSGNIVTWHQEETENFIGRLRIGTTERPLLPPKG